MKTINKEMITKFINTKDGQKILMYVGIGILICMLWKVILIVAIIVGAVYLIKKNRRRK